MEQLPLSEALAQCTPHVLSEVYRDDSQEIRLDAIETAAAANFFREGIPSNQDGEVETPFMDFIPEPDVFPKWIEGVDTTYAPYLPTSFRLMSIALERAGCKGRKHKLLDLGSGDGRFCTTALCTLGFGKAIGIETDDMLVARSVALADISFFRIYRELCSSIPESIDASLKDEKIAHIATFIKELRSRCIFHNDVIESDAMKPVIEDETVTCLILFLSSSFTKVWKPYIMDCFNRGCTIISMLFDLSEVEGLIPFSVDAVDRIYIYRKPT